MTKKEKALLKIITEICDAFIKTDKQAFTKTIGNIDRELAKVGLERREEKRGK